MNIVNAYDNKPKKIYLDMVIQDENKIMELLIEKLPKLSKTKIKSLLKYGQVVVNNKVVTKYDYILKKGQSLTVFYGVKEESESLLPVLYEDDYIIVVEKPEGLLTISTDKKEGVTAFSLMMEYIRQSKPKSRIFIVHRLDRDTSGILIFSKSEKIKLELQNKWADIIKTRGYVAVVEGVLDKNEDRIISWLKENKAHKVYSTNSEESAVKAITNYKFIRGNKDYSLVDIWIETGRKNQIRVNMSDLGNPIVGDKKYGASGNPVKRLCLHAYKLNFEHPINNNIMEFELSIPKKFKDLVKNNQ